MVVTELDKETLSAIWGENWEYLCLCNTFGSSQSHVCGIESPTLAMLSTHAMLAASWCDTLTHLGIDAFVLFGIRTLIPSSFVSLAYNAIIHGSITGSLNSH